MKTKNQLVFCNTCDKATYVSAIAWHNDNCRLFNSGIDCMCCENENLFCGCAK